MGKCASACTAGKDAPCTDLPFFYSDLFDLGYEAVGMLDARLETVEQWETTYRKGVMYYLEGGACAARYMASAPAAGPARWRRIDASRGRVELHCVGPRRIRELAVEAQA